MSIIIRLQNLPWAANAMDIRQFFSGLQIPEGGVHIVGGELGDAFIAFSTDEDARQAFQRNDGTIKGIQIKLMLSSRTEMQRVIEQARNQSMAAFMLPTTNPVPPISTTTPLPAIVPNVLPAAVMAPTGPDMMTAIMPAAVPEMDRDQKEDRKKDKRRSRSRSRDRRDKSRDRRDRRYRDRSRSKSRDRRDRRRGRDRSRERSRDKDSRTSRRDRTKSSDKRDYQQDGNKQIPEIWNRPPQIASGLNIIPPVALKSDAVGLLGAAPWNLEQPHLNPMQNLPQIGGMNGLPALPRGRESWPPGRDPMSRSPMGGFPPNQPILPPNSARGMSRMSLQDPLTNGPRNTFDSSMSMRGGKSDMLDIRDIDIVGGRFGNNFNDNTMRREPFIDGANDFNNMSNYEMNSRRHGGGGEPDYTNNRFGPRKSRFDLPSTPINACVSVEPFYGAYGDLRRFFNGISINYKGVKIINDEFGHKTGICFVQFRDVSNKLEALKMNGRLLNNIEVKIRSITDKLYDEAVDKYNPRMDEGGQEQLIRTQNTKKLLANEPEIKDFVCLKLEDLPSFVKEQDILHIFSQHPLLSLHLVLKPKGGTVAYVKFGSKDVAKLAFEEKSHHFIRGKSITVKPCTEEEFTEISKPQVEALKLSKAKTESDSVSITNLPEKTTDRDVTDFFSDIGITPIKTHLMNSEVGFTGQAYCEFETSEEATKALTKDKSILGNNTISVESISRQELDTILDNTVPYSDEEIPAVHAAVKEEGLEETVRIEEQELTNQSSESQSVRSNDTKLTSDTPTDPKASLHFRAPMSKNNTHSQSFGPEEPSEETEAERRHFGRLNFERPRDSDESDYFDDYHRPQSHWHFDQSRGNFGPGQRGGGRFARGNMRFNGPRASDNFMDEDIPGCTVYMDNVPYKAGTNEILDFFRGYNCTNNVSRRYNPNNTPSAEAKVTFYSPDDAFRAVQELHGAKIWGRSIFLKQQ